MVSFLTFGDYGFLRLWFSFVTFVGSSNSYVRGLVFLRLGVRDSYVWGLVFLRLGVRKSYVWWLVFLRLGSVIRTFGG